MYINIIKYNYNTNYITCYILSTSLFTLYNYFMSNNVIITVKKKINISVAIY